MAESESAPQADIDEFEVKARYWTTEVVNQRLAATFPGESYRAAALWLAELGGEDPGGDEEVAQLATCRLMLAALKVSDGSLERLALWVQAGRADPRDLIGAAEYRRELAGEDPRARAADMAEYIEWVSGSPTTSMDA